MKKDPLNILLPEASESAETFVHRLKQEISSGSNVLLVVLLPLEDFFIKEKNEWVALIDFCEQHKQKLILVTKNRRFKKTCQTVGITVYTRLSQLKNLLLGHPQANEVLDLFKPKSNPRDTRSKLQSMGLLSLPTVRIWLLIVLCLLVFLFISLKLLPSAEIRVWPSQNNITQTTNIFLANSESEVDIPERVRKMELKPFAVKTKLSMTFDGISQEFTGQSSKVVMTIINKSDEPFSLLKGTRFVNQAGMVFRTVAGVTVEAKSETNILTEADDFDIFNVIIGERGNVPAKLKWDIPGLTPEEQKLTYGENQEKAEGGITSYRSLFQQKDMETARRQLEQSLLVEAKRIIEEQKELYNSQNPKQVIELLNRSNYENTLTKATYFDFNLGQQFVGEEMTSVPIEGSIEYTVYGFDKEYAKQLLETELLGHISNNKRLVKNSITLDRLQYFVISYNDDLAWIKLTVDLTGSEEFVLDPFEPAGSQFSAKVRQMIKGLTKKEALRVLKNLPEVRLVEISLWPPWTKALPDIPSHIRITPQSDN